jgi:hypothetical protein
MTPADGRASRLDDYNFPAFHPYLHDGPLLGG